VPFAAIRAVQPAMRWSPVILPPRQAVRAVTAGEAVRAKAGMAVRRLTRHTTVFTAPRPISVFLELAIVDLAVTRAANLEIVCFCESKAPIGSRSPAWPLNRLDDGADQGEPISRASYCDRRQTG
jgi:hypothetical protein